MEIKENNIYLGDCYELIKEMKDKSVDLILTEPPYQIDGIHRSGILNQGSNRDTYTKIAETSLDKGIDLKILDDFVRVMKKINIYIWCNKEQIYDYMTYFVKERKCSFEILVWCKEDSIPFCGTHYLCDKEYCLYFWEQGAPVYIPYERGRTYYITKRNTTDKAQYKHPTCKLTDLLEILIKNSTGWGANKQIIVFDPFMGSASTCIAAKHCGCSYIGFEINEKYFQIAKDRLSGINQKGEMNLFDIDYE